MLSKVGGSQNSDFLMVHHGSMMKIHSLATAQSLIFCFLLANCQYLFKKFTNLISIYKFYFEFCIFKNKSIINVSMNTHKLYTLQICFSE